MADPKKLKRPNKLDQNIKANIDISELLGSNEGLDKINYLLAFKYLKIRKNILNAVIKKTQGGKLTGLKLGKEIKISELLGEPPQSGILFGLKWLRTKNIILKKVAAAAKDANFEFGKEIDINDILGSAPEQDFITKTRFFLIRQKLLSKISKAVKDFNAKSMLPGIAGIEGETTEIDGIDTTDISSSISSAEGLSTDESLDELRGIHAGINNIFDHLLDDKSSKLKDREEKREQIARNERRHNEMLDATKGGAGGFGSGGFGGEGEGGGGGKKGFLRSFLEFKFADKVMRRGGATGGGLLKSAGSRALGLGRAALPATAALATKGGALLSAAATSTPAMMVGAGLGGYAVGTGINNIPKLLGSEDRFSDMMGRPLGNMLAKARGIDMSGPLPEEKMLELQRQGLNANKPIYEKRGIPGFRKKVITGYEKLDRAPMNDEIARGMEEGLIAARGRQDESRIAKGLAPLKPGDKGYMELPDSVKEYKQNKKARLAGEADRVKAMTSAVPVDTRINYEQISNNSSKAVESLTSGESLNPILQENILFGLAAGNNLEGAQAKLDLKTQAYKAGELTKEDYSEYITGALIRARSKSGQDTKDLKTLYGADKKGLLGESPAGGLSNVYNPMRRLMSSPTETATGQKAESASNSSPTETATGKKTEIKSGYGMVNGQFTAVIDGMPYQYGEQIVTKTQNGKVVQDAFCYIKKGAGNLDDDPENHRVDKESYAKFVEKMDSTDWLSSPKLSAEEIRNMKSAPAPKQAVPKELPVSVPNIGMSTVETKNPDVVPTEKMTGQLPKPYTAYDKRTDAANNDLARFEKYNDSDYTFSEVDGIGYRRKYNDAEKQKEYEDLLKWQKRVTRRKDYQPVGGVDERSAEYYKQNYQQLIDSGEHHNSFDAQDLKYRYLESMGYGTRVDYDDSQVEHEDLWQNMFLQESEKLPSEGSYTTGMSGDYQPDAMMHNLLMKREPSKLSLDSTASIPSSTGMELTMAQKENSQLKGEGSRGGEQPIVAPTNVTNSNSNVTNTTIAAPPHIDRTQNNFGAVTLAY